MSLFDAVKLDKLRLVYDKKNIPFERRTTIKDILKFYYPDSLDFSKAGLVMHSFTPTKLVGDRGADLNHNLQMPTNTDFLEAIEDITLHNQSIQDTSWFSEIHVAKDLLLAKPVNDYILMLSEKLYSYLKPELIESDGTYNLYLHYLRNLESEGRYKFVIKMYNKAVEYFKRHGTYICPLYEKPTKEEIVQLGSAYDSINNTIDLSKVNWLRIEIEFHESSKISPIIKKISDTDDKLTASLFIKALRSGTLNKILENVFNEVLLKHVFNTKESIDKATDGVSGIRKLACELLLESDCYHYEAVANELELENQFSELSKIVKKVAPDSELYNELYNKLFQSYGKNREGIETLMADIYSNKFLKYWLLIYSVFIWDDS